MNKLFAILILSMLPACNPRIGMNGNKDNEATCTAKCYSTLNSQSYLAGKYMGATPEGYLVCECLEYKPITIGDKTITQPERRIVVERKPSK